MKLLTSLTSPYGRKIRLVLAEKRIDYELVQMLPNDPDNGLSLLNPLGKVPVLILDDGLALYDSPVIAKYLDEVTPVGRLIPKEHRQGIRVKLLEALSDGITDAAVLVVLEGRRPRAQQSSEWIAKQMLKIERGVAAMAKELGEQKWFCDSRFSLADIAAACTLAYLDLRIPNFDWRKLAPNLEQFLSLVEKEKPEFAATKPPTES